MTRSVQQGASSAATRAETGADKCTDPTRLNNLQLNYITGRLPPAPPLTQYQDINQLDRDASMESLKDLDAQGEIRRVKRQAPYKDTIPVGDSSVVIVRFRADNPASMLAIPQCYKLDNYAITAVLSVNVTNTPVL
ncbi:L-ascorbate oxidase [Elysia marginata]|uniref:L-ascorbate oxidase n=1 Tax=Elysia marginata TaxID=1093978 RepID=A0AAV4G1Q6_9GAST|nr:L-ascorbate oxidase [Elysia marginata]